MNYDRLHRVRHEVLAEFGQLLEKRCLDHYDLVALSEEKNPTEKLLNFSRLIVKHPDVSSVILDHMDRLGDLGCGLMKTIRYWYMEKFLWCSSLLPLVHHEHCLSIHPEAPEYKRMTRIVVEDIDDLYT